MKFSSEVNILAAKIREIHGLNRSQSFKQAMLALKFKANMAQNLPCFMWGEMVDGKTVQRFVESPITKGYILSVTRQQNRSNPKYNGVELLGYLIRGEYRTIYLTNVLDTWF